MIIGKYINKYYKKFLIPLFFAFAALLFVNYLQVQIPKLFGKLTDGLTYGTITSMDGVHSILLTVGILVILTVIMRVVWRLCLLLSTRKIIYYIRNDMYKSLEKMSPKYYQHKKTGDLMAYYTNDLTALDRAISWGSLMFFDFLVLTPLIVFNMIKQTNIRLTLYVSAPILIYLLYILIFGKLIKGKFLKAQESFSNLSDFVQENVSGINVIKAYNKQDYSNATFDFRSSDYRNKTLAHVKLDALFNNVSKILFAVVYTILLIFGYMDYQNGLVTIGDITAMVQYIVLLNWPLHALGMAVNATSKGKASYQRILEIINLKEDVSKGKHKDEILDETIEFKDLSFKYEDKYVLKNVSFKINKGEFVGIIGRTGSGKTTLMKLLLKYYNLEKDSLFIGPLDIMDIETKALRQLYGYSPQDNFMFQKTIEDNIKYSKLDATHDEVVEASKEADFYANVMNFSNIFNTYVGERGVSLSGGQKQRLSIARALVKDPKVLMLDDSLSAVDTKTEEKILNNLDRLRKNKTTIVIANRISTIKNADKIILLDEGMVVGIGTHEELKRSSELYNSINNLQKLQSEYGIEGGIDE